MKSEKRTVRLKVSPQAARIVGKDAPRELRLSAARGALPLSGGDLVTALFFLCNGGDREITASALATLRKAPPSLLVPVVEDPETHPKLLDFIARLHTGEEVVGALLSHRALPAATLVHLASRCEGRMPALIARHYRGSPEVVEALLSNPHADPSLKRSLGLREEPPDAEEEVPVEEVPVEEEKLSKYQQAMEMGVSEKIKYAMTGDKEWRGLFLKDSNKLVSSAVMKNPRITDGEVLTVAKSNSSNDELIRLITMNREWVKSYEIKKALVCHARTPLPKALRYMNALFEKDLKDLAKSRNVSQVIVNNARRMLEAKKEKR